MNPQTRKGVRDRVFGIRLLVQVFWTGGVARACGTSQLSDVPWVAKVKLGYITCDTDPTK